MKKKHLIPISIIFCFTLSGCLAFKGMFSDGQEDLKKANDLWQNGQQLAALVHGTQSVITDPEFIQGKNFLRDFFDQGINSSKNRLAELGTPQNAENAEEQFKIYDNLVKVYANLSKIKLPLSHPKGKWSWTTDIVDYTAQLQNSKELAFTLLMKEARASVKAKDIAEAQKKFHNAIDNYLTNGQQQDSTKKVVFDELCTFGESFSSTKNIDDAKVGHAAFVSALTFIKSDPKAQDGVQKMAEHISILYATQGKQLASKGGVENLIASIESFKNALKWDKANIDAQNSIATVTEKIAEYYYQEGVKAQNSNDLSKAIAMYEESRKWIPDYKDCMSRIYTLRIGGKIDELAKNLAVTQTEFEKMQNRVNSVSPAVDKSVEIMDKVTYVSDKTRDLNEVMKNTSTTLKVFKVIPTVGTATGILARSIDLGQEPVGKVAQKFSMIEQPIITPTKNVVGKAKGIVDNVKGKMESTTNVLKTTREYSLKLKDCIAHVTEERNFKEAEIALDEINKGLVKTNEKLIEINSGFAKIENETKKIAQFSGPVEKVSKGLHEVDKVVSKIKPVIDELNDALRKQFTLNLLVKKYTFSVEKILTGMPDEVKAIMDKFSDLAMGVVKPILKKFDINIPTIPGIEQISNELDKLKDYYNALNVEVDRMQNQVAEYTNYQQQISNNITKLENAVGCQIGQANIQ